MKNVQLTFLQQASEETDELSEWNKYVIRQTNFNFKKSLTD